MAFKFIALLTFAAVVSAGVIVPIVPAINAVTAVTSIVKTVAVAQPVLTKTVEESDTHPQYKYTYYVQDPASGDFKSHIEERDGDVVRGEYSLIDADGYKRIVQYTADALNGFNAVVRRIPLKSIKSVSKIAAIPVAASAVVTNVAPVATVAITAAEVAHH